MFKSCKVASSKAEIWKYAAHIDAERFPYFCAATGVLAENLRDVISATFLDLCRYGVWHRWHRTSARKYC